MKMEIIDTRSHDIKSPGFFTVIVDDLFADRLTRGEALEVVAFALFNESKYHPYLKSYEQWTVYETKWGTIIKPIALLEGNA